MGNDVSGCFGSEPKAGGESDRKFSHVFPTPLAYNTILPSDKYDHRFYFIRNEEEIDKAIDKLDESAVMTDAKAAVLEYTLAELRNQKNKLTIFPSYDSADRMASVDEADQEQEVSPTLPLKQLLLKAETPAKLRRPHTMTNFTEFSFGKVKKEILQGNLLIEVQKAQFLHPQFLNRYGLSRPYVMLKIYRTEKGREVRRNSQWVEITKFQTVSAPDSLKPSWEELFEYRVNDEKKASTYYFGFTLYYMDSKDQTGFQVGEEQIFSVGSLLDQELQTRLIDFKDPKYKGILTRLNVRFQFIHDQEMLKEKIVKEIKTKMERLSKIREKHPIFQYEKKPKGSIFELSRRSFSHRGSEFSQSSTHENTDSHGYYLDPSQI